MKTLFVLILLELSVNCFCQKKADAPAVKISREKISKTNTLKELIGYLPSDCTIAGYIIGMSFQGQYRELSSSGDTLSPMMKKYMRSASTFFIEKIRSDCGGVKASYKFTVE